MKKLLSKPGMIPELEVFPLNREVAKQFSSLIKYSGIKEFSPKIEVWTSSHSNKALAYLSHGIFRYFGKFPPTIASHIIKKYSKEHDLIMDPMCGSGTSGLEALLLKRKAVCFDVNPLSILISKVKITRLSKESSLKYLEKVLGVAKSKKKVPAFNIVGLKNPNHWFLPETIDSLSKIKFSIENTKLPKDIKDALLVAFLSVVRRASRATTQQGRLFLDVETAVKDAIPLFEKKALAIINQVSLLPKNTSIVKIEKKSATDDFLTKEKCKVIICHPPYFNAYKYSGVNSLELAWLGLDHAEVRKYEIRESFKVGKAEKLDLYLQDMEVVLRNLSKYLSKGGVVVLMIGDTVMKGTYLPVTKKLLQMVSDIYRVDLSALRIPRFTEASWAASQRRSGDQVGISLCDLIVVLKKK